MSLESIYKHFGENIKKEKQILLLHEYKDIKIKIYYTQDFTDTSYIADDVLGINSNDEALMGTLFFDEETYDWAVEGEYNILYNVKKFIFVDELVINLGGN